MKRVLIILLLFIKPCYLFSQGYNHQWLLGNNPFAGFPNGRIYFNSTSFLVNTEMRKMSFTGTEANISDTNGNFLMSSNGIWVANSNNDTMQNGSGLNPNGITASWPNGLPMTANNLFLPYPADSNKYVLFHHTATFDGYSYSAYELYYSIIDISLDGGLGSVIQKNIVAFNDTLNWGIGACKSANGRDWWVLVSKQNTDTVFKVLFTDAGIQSITPQDLGTEKAWYNTAQLCFSNDGKKFAYAVYDSATVNSNMLIFDFDRCTGQLSNGVNLPITNNELIWGSAFSPSGKYLYSCSSTYIFQTDLTTLITDTVAIYDGFISPPSSTCCPTTFWNMYLAANGKIYVTSGSSVQHLHEINYPDSAGLACDVQQHAIDLVDYLHIRAVPNHPNYYLGCDTTSGCPCLITGLNELQQHDFKFSVAPNPTNGNIKIMYLLPQNSKGVFEVYDVTGKKVFSNNLPPWSTLQNFNLSFLGNGIYNCSITSANQRVNKKLIVIH